MTLHLCAGRWILYFVVVVVVDFYYIEAPGELLGPSVGGCYKD